MLHKGLTEAKDCLDQTILTFLLPHAGYFPYRTLHSPQICQILDDQDSGAPHEILQKVLADFQANVPTYQFQ